MNQINHLIQVSLIIQINLCSISSFLLYFFPLLFIKFKSYTINKNYLNYYLFKNTSHFSIAASNCLTVSSSIFNFFSFSFISLLHDSDSFSVAVICVLRVSSFFFNSSIVSIICCCYFY